MKIGCDQAASHALKIVVPDRLSDETAAEGLMGVELCQACAAEAQVGPFLTANPSLRALLRNLATPGTDPDFDLAYMEGVPSGGVEHQAFAALAERKPN